MKLTRKQKNQEINFSDPTFHTIVLEKSECEEKTFHKKQFEFRLQNFLIQLKRLEESFSNQNFAMLKVLLTSKKVIIKICTPFDRFEEDAAKFCFFLTDI